MMSESQVRKLNADLEIALKDACKQNSHEDAMLWSACQSVTLFILGEGEGDPRVRLLAELQARVYATETRKGGLLIDPDFLWQRNGSMAHRAEEA